MCVRACARVRVCVCVCCLFENCVSLNGFSPFLISEAMLTYNYTFS